MKHLIFIALGAILLSGCANLGFVDASKYKAPSEKQTIQVDEDVTFEVPSRSGAWLTYQYILPKGEYVSTIEDENGVYFDSKNGHYRDVKNDRDTRGGIYWPKDGSALRLSWWPTHSPGEGGGGIYAMAGSGKVPLPSVFIPSTVRRKIKGPNKALVPTVTAVPPAADAPVAPAATAAHL